MLQGSHCPFPALCCHTAMRALCHKTRQNEAHWFCSRVPSNRAVKLLAARCLNTDPNAPYIWESFAYHKVFTKALSASAKLYVNKCLLLIKVIQLQGLKQGELVTRKGRCSHTLMWMQFKISSHSPCHGSHTAHAGLVFAL